MTTKLAAYEGPDGSILVSIHNIPYKQDILYLYKLQRHETKRVRRYLRYIEKSSGKNFQTFNPQILTVSGAHGLQYGFHVKMDGAHTYGMSFVCVPMGMIEVLIVGKSYLNKNDSYDAFKLLQKKYYKKIVKSIRFE